MATQNSTINGNGIEAYASSWGYHPCDYETFCKIRRLRRHYLKSLSQAKAWFRWARKAEHNRKGQEPAFPPVFCESVSSRGAKFASERKFNPKMGYTTSDRSMHTTWVKADKGEAYIYNIPEGFEPEEVKASWGTYTRQKPIGANHAQTLIVRSHAIEEAYQQARMPVEHEDQVKQLPIPIGQIDAMLAEIDEWQKSR